MVQLFRPLTDHTLQLKQAAQFLAWQILYFIQTFQSVIQFVIKFPEVFWSLLVDLAFETEVDADSLVVELRS